MRTVIGMILLVVGAIIGGIGDFSAGSYGMMVVGGLIIAAGVVVLLLSSASRGGRGDEPPGHIYP